MTRVLWFSRHVMTDEQRGALVSKHGEIEINQIDKSISSAKELQKEIDESDVIAIVAPIGLQAEFVRLAGGKPVIVALNDRIIVKNDDGSETKTEFHFVKWERLVKIEVIKEDY